MCHMVRQMVSFQRTVLSVGVGYYFSKSVRYLVFWVKFLSLRRGLADTKQTGKLTREQFSLAMYLIQQKTTKGVDPPSTLTPDMIPPSERTAASAAAHVSPDLAHCFTFQQLFWLKCSLSSKASVCFTCICTWRFLCFSATLCIFNGDFCFLAFQACRTVFIHAFAFFELFSVLSNRAMRGLWHPWELNMLH